ncbi:cell division protein ZapB [Marinobacterium litorale]|jgi:FtsZ-binding cell division protein ZapB|uniref:cell division protein ZapB n=1 Tax=Marinobacterium litorale TaxID=404770 RepID=UPI00042A2F3E|nr:cell division protein ZapB [Marinobacterium litorale]
MQSELFSELEQKIENLIEEVELMRLEISELKEERDALASQRGQTDERLQQLLQKFNRLEETASA